MLHLSSAAGVQALDADSICWITESGQGIWTSPGVGELLGHLQSEAGRETILQCYDSALDRERAASTLDRLISMGLLESASCLPALSQLCRELGADPQCLTRKRWENGAILMADDRESGEALAAAFSEVGVPQGSEGALRVIAVEDYLDSRIEELHREFQATGVTWMLLKMAGEEIWLGPIFLPRETPCWRCLAERLREKRWLERQIGNGERPFTPYHGRQRLAVAAELAAQEAARWLVDAHGALAGRIRSFSWKTLETEIHPLGPHGRCRDCYPQPASPAPMELRSVFVRWRPPGEVRARAGRSLLRDWPWLAGPIAGIVTRPEQVESTPVFYSCAALHNAALPPTEMRARGALLQPLTCSGRGRTAAEAEEACLAEAVERYSIQFRGDERRITARGSELQASAIHPDSILRFREAQNGEETPEPFDPEEEIEWMAGWSLTSRRWRYLPMALASLRYRPPGKRWIGSANSSGCSAGSCREEAILHALLELIERYSLDCWLSSREALPAYDSSALEDSLCRRACARLKEEGWRVWLHEITTEMKTAAIVAIGADKDGQWIRGSAAHIHKASAVRAAVAELYQLSSYGPRFTGIPAYSRMESLGLDAGTPTPRTDDLKQLIDRCRCPIEEMGYEVIVFDLTRVEIGFPVVRIVISRDLTA